MKVAILASLLRPISAESNGGTEAFAHTLTEGLVKSGIDTTLFAASDSVTQAHLESVCSSIQTNGVTEGTIAVNVLYEMLQASNVLANSHNFDIIHNNYWHFYALNNYAQLIDKPIITTMHNHFWDLPNLKEVFTKTHRRGKDMIVFSSYAAQRLAKDLVDTTVIYHGIDVSDFPYSDTADDYFLSFSRLIPAKGIGDAIKAAKMGNFKLIAAGGLPIREVDKEIIDAEVMPEFNDPSNQISYAGMPDEQGRLKLYQNAKALLFPTQLEEQFGFVLAEAMSSGTPVIGYNRGAVSEVIKDGVTGFVIDPDDSPRPGKGSWVIKEQGVAGLVEATKRVGELDRAACRAHIETNFTRERMVSDYIALYQRLAQ